MDRKSYGWLTCLALLAIHLHTGTTLAESAELVSPPQTPSRVQFSADAPKPVISYRQILPEFADQDPTPLVRIYGDGRVLVHRPAYLKNSGTFEMRMPANELDAFVQQVAPAIIEFDTNRVNLEMARGNQLLMEATDRIEDVVLFYDADAPVSVFHIEIDSYKPEGAGKSLSKLQAMQLRWQGLKFDARDFPDLTELTQLRETELKLRALSLSGDLVPTGDEQ